MRKYKTQYRNEKKVSEVKVLSRIVYQTKNERIDRLKIW